MTKNPILELSEAYKQKKIEKYSYIDKQHKFNKVLFYLSERIKQTDIKKIEITDDSLLFTTRTDNIKLVFSGLDRRGVPFDILNFEKYEKEDEFFLRNCLDDQSIIFDVGANIGWYSLFFSKVRPNSIIHSFEPIKSIYETFIINLKLNGSNNIIANNIALSNNNKTSEYYYFPEGAVLSSKENLINCKKAKKTFCEESTLDQYVQNKNLTKIDLIKCDVEGAEFDVIKGAKETIQKFSPILFIEIFEGWTRKFGYTPNELMEYLFKMNYSCFLANYEKIEKVLEYVETEEERLNFIFLHKTKHDGLIKKYLK